MSRYLIVADRTAAGAELLSYVRKAAKDDPGSEFTVLVPASPPSYWRPWDEFAAQQHGREVAATAARTLRDDGVAVTREAVGGREPLAAIEDELREHPDYDAIIISTFPVGASRWLRRDVVTRTRQRTGLPVSHVIVGPTQKTVPHHLDEMPVEPDRPPAERGTRAVPGRSPHSYFREDDVAGLPSCLSVPMDMTPEIKEGWSRLESGPTANLFRALAERPLLLHGYVGLLQSCWQSPGLDAETRELVMLLAARARKSEYAWHQHVLIARDLGIDEEKVIALEHWRSSYRVEFSERERAIFNYVEAVCHDGDIGRAGELLRQHLDEGQLLLVAMLVGLATLSALLSSALAVQPEDEFVGWLI